MYRNSVIYPLFVCILMAFTAIQVSAQAPTAAQIQQFQNLSPEQQRALAERFGIDLDGLISDAVAAQPQLNQDANANRQNRLAGESNRGRRGVESEQEELDALLSVDGRDGEDEQSGNQEEGELELYGYSLFEQAPNSFLPATDIPIPNDYVMGPGDTVVVQLYGKQNSSYSLVVNREGQIQFPEIGPVSLAGLKFSQAQEVLNDTVAEQMIGVKSSITMGALRSIRVFVLGDVKYPGSYPVNSLSTMTNALFESGGIADIGSLRKIQLKRQGKVMTTMDLYDLLLHGDTSNDARLLPGDVIFVPPIGNTISIDGAVKRPAIYELNGETNMADAARLAGGFLSTAYLKTTQVERIDQDGRRTVLDIDLSSSSGRSVRPRDGDALVIDAVLDVKENVVTLSGHVKRSRDFKWRAGMRLLDIVRGVDDLLPNPDVSYALLKRETQPKRRIEIAHIDLAAAFSRGQSAANIKLRPGDELIVFGYEEDRGEILEELVGSLELQASKFEKAMVVEISGHVRFPAKYPLSKNMSVANILEIAGGLSEYAYGLEAEITRREQDTTEQQRIVHTPVGLSNGEASTVILQPGDRVVVKRIPNWVPSEVVTIEGEVAFPGEYTISRGETLSEVLARAGGLTTYAYAKGAVFTREALRELEEERLIQLQQRLEADILAAELEQKNGKSKVAAADAEGLLADLRGVKPQGRMVIDLPKILKSKKASDVALSDGDKLLVPRYKQSVTVVGEVQYPTSHIFEDQLSVGDYIDRSGGINERADKRRIYVVKANGRVYLPERSGWFKRGDVGIEAGDTVVVPLDADRIESLALWSSVSQIFSQIAVGAAAINSF